MLFNSLAFAAFLPIVFIAYWLMPQKYKWVFMLIASYVFYISCDARYVAVILLTTVISYFSGIVLEKENSDKTKKLTLTGTVLLCLSVLFFFKYFNFFSSLTATVANVLGIRMQAVTKMLVLPIGISFYLFQIISYVVDVYKGKIEAEHHFGYYATFISFFPKLVAGPIERGNTLLPQIKTKKVFDYTQATYGLKQMAWGYYKKLVIADVLAVYVNRIFDMPQNFKGFALCIASVLFTIQIYCDFSGYSDIAIGTAKLLGIDLIQNFKSPYFSQSVKEFWSRWHISLSTWFRDYIYIPMGGNRVSRARHIFNLMITFMASGLWHGANYTFVVWGAVHGFAQVLENIFVSKDKLKSTGIVRWLRILVVFIFATFAWIFFISKSITDAVYVLGHMFAGISNPVAYLRNGFVDIGLPITTLLLICITVLILAVYDYISLKGDVIELISEKKLWIRWSIYVLLVISVIFLSQKGVTANFVYAQF